MFDVKEGWSKKSEVTIKRGWNVETRTSNSRMVGFFLLAGDPHSSFRYICGGKHNLREYEIVELGMIEVPEFGAEDV